MKRILTILLCVVLLCSTFVFSASAAVTDYPDVSPEPGYPYFHYFVFMSAGNYTALGFSLKSDSVPLVFVDAGGQAIAWDCSFMGDCVVTEFMKIGDTTYPSTKSKGGSITTDVNNILYSSFDILESRNGDVFYPGSSYPPGGPVEPEPDYPDVGEMEIHGSWTFNPTITMPSDPHFFDSFTVNFYEETPYGFGALYTGFSFGTYTDENYLMYHAPGIDNTTLFPAYNIDSNEWYSMYMRNINFKDGGIVPTKFYNWLKDNAVENYCYGSDSCPTGDTNEDGYCEDCFRMMRTSADVTEYPINLPPMPDGLNGASYRQVVISDDTGTYLYAWDTNRWEVYATGGRLFLNQVPGVGSVYGYRLNGDSWSSFTVSTVGYLSSSTSERIVWSSHDIYDEYGNRFFPYPLWYQIQTVTEGSMEVEIPKLTTTAKVLVVCSVGLLALLIGLPLLTKVLNRFL